MTLRKILIVDDAQVERDNLKNIVSSAGYDSMTATSGKDALEKVKQFNPDLIFLDIVMPEMDGFATCRELTKDAATKNIPVIFVSSKDAEADRVWAQLQGAKAYVTKPYSEDQIIEQINNFS
ncbi:MAG: response regulator [Methylococcales bacterium]|nr:response regulator [Methylococcales bacterium]